MRWIVTLTSSDLERLHRREPVILTHGADEFVVNADLDNHTCGACGRAFGGAVMSVMMDSTAKASIE